jgi:hypothetical protein
VFREWTAIRGDYYLPHVAIIESVARSGFSDYFAMNFSHLDPTLAFAMATTEPTMRDCIVVPGFGWKISASPGNVRIWHQSFSGQVEDIERPAHEAVPLFWRFVAEKFGIHYDHAASGGQPEP